MPLVNSKSEVVPTQKVVYIDRIKVILTVMVVFHHVHIAYGAPGKWYYREPTQNEIAFTPMPLWVGANQSFMMALFFMLSAYFVEPSYQRKGTAIYIKDRLIRLGIPLLFYSFFLSPLINYLIGRYGHGHQTSLLEFLMESGKWINVGVLWFVAALLLFTLLDLVFRQSPTFSCQIKFPAVGSILLFGVNLGLVCFGVRLFFPVGWTIPLVDFQPGHFPQYIAYFVVGLLARQNGWFNQLSHCQSKKFAWLAALFVLFVLPLISGLCLAFEVPMEQFNGGWNWAALAYSFWEQITGLSIIVALVGISQNTWNYTDDFWIRISRNAFGVYVFHPLVIIFLTLWLSQASFSSLYKLAIVAPPAVAGSFLLVHFIRQMPVVKRII